MKNKAGCLPFYYDGEKLKLLFMKPSDPAYGGAYYQIAKGRIDDGFTIEGTARKEALEEVGLESSNIKHLFFVDVDVIKNYKLHVFAAEVKNPQSMVPFHYETGDIQWLDVSEIETKVRRCQHDIIYKAIKVINEI